jgi:hypothetical protein
MEMYKEATRLGLRVQTTRGPLSIEQLWDLKLTELDALAVSLQEAHEKSKSKSFLDTKTVKDKGIKLQFDIVLDILNTKNEEQKAAKESARIKAHNNRIDELIAEKKDKVMEAKSIKDLEKMRIPVESED